MLLPRQAKISVAALLVCIAPAYGGWGLNDVVNAVTNAPAAATIHRDLDCLRAEVDFERSIATKM
ncbi:MAG: hypothetical protein DID90_2727553105 [Candidatus Nitrotoga sp. LAW]|nr:MAG: hypothetical protein DID90_2727553105 [Candidatus Nitrotoga sp. LAW]